MAAFDGPVLFIHTKKDCPHCVSFKDPKTLQEIKDLIESIDPSATIKSVQHNDWADMNKMEIYPHFNLPWAPFIFITSGAESGYDGDFKQATIWRGEYSEKDKKIVQKSGEDINSWIRKTLPKYVTKTKENKPKPKPSSDKIEKLPKKKNGKGCSFVIVSSNN
jgi:hypothetical protein